MLSNFSLLLPPQRARPWTFLTSYFSHAGMLHLGINMLALSSFGSVIVKVGQDCPRLRCSVMTHACHTYQHRNWKCLVVPLNAYVCVAGFWTRSVCCVLLVGWAGLFNDDLPGALEARHRRPQPGRLWRSLCVLCCHCLDAPRSKISLLTASALKFVQRSCDALLLDGRCSALQDSFTGK